MRISRKEICSKEWKARKGEASICELPTHVGYPHVERGVGGGVDGNDDDDDDDGDGDGGSGGGGGDGGDGGGGGNPLKAFALVAWCRRKWIPRELMKSFWKVIEFLRDFTIPCVGFQA
ncbi:hypothetical protein HZH68_011069 [Vespula germanica]|uniref:Uncharacterized protein n=1 Tax=Vespula germanica TaxID=30212 RepID=A0A834JQ07_VESGE|nr:hypothetical protein HZH68_011069 [Vespula germanica]